MKNETIKHMEMIKQPFVKSELDYSILEAYKPMIKELSINNGYVFIVDMYKFECLFLMSNRPELYGIEPHLMPEAVKMSYMESRIHPDDKTHLWPLHNQLIHFLQSKPLEERLDYKYVSNMRISDLDNKYKNVTIQYQILKMDTFGNIWLILCIEDLSPIQDVFVPVNCTLINYKTGQTFSLNTPKNDSFKLSPREKQVLNLIKEGFLSKQISETLSISIKTVNRHRQNIFEKMQVVNSHEAVNVASKMGLF